MLTLDSLFSGRNCTQTRDLASKISKKFPEGDTPGPPPRTATRRAWGHKVSRCWDLGLGNRSPTSKFTTTPLLTVPSDSQTDNSTHSANWQAANSQRHALSFPLSIDGIKLAIFVRMNWIGGIRESDSTAYYQLQRASWFLTITHTHALHYWLSTFGLSRV